MNYFISFSKSELEALRLFDSFENVQGVSKGLKKSKPTAYRVIKKLKNKGIIEENNLASIPYLKKLVLLLKNNQNLVNLFRDSNLAILLQTLTLKTVNEISEQTNCDKQTVYKALQQARRIGLVKKIKNQFVINSDNWPKGKEFFEELQRQETSFDKRTPRDAIIYHKTEKEIIFATKQTTDATKTAFSAFEQFGVKYYPKTNYYYLPKKKLTAQEAFNHAILTTKTDFDYRDIVMLAIFLLKNKIQSDDEITKNLYRIFAGQVIEKYPTKKDLQEKAELYGVKLS